MSKRNCKSVHFRTNFICGLILITVGLSGFPPAQADEAETTEAERVLDLMSQARANLQRGEFKAVGQKTVVQPESARVESSPVELHALFDYTTSRLRYKSAGQSAVKLMSASQLKPESLQQLRDQRGKSVSPLRDVTAVLVRNPAYMASWYSIGNEHEANTARGNIELLPPQTMPNPIVLRSLYFFDPQAAGLIDLNEFKRYRRLNELLAEFKSRLSPTFKLEPREQGIVRLVFETAYFRRKIDIDSARGYTVKRMQLVAIDETGAEQPLPRVETEAAWKKVAETYVPTEFSILSSFNDGEVRSFQYELDWLSVNPPSETWRDEQFGYESFQGVWNNVAVYDSRDEKPKMLKVIGQPAAKQVPPNSLAAPAGASFTYRLWFVLGNLILAGCVVVYLIWQRLQRTA